MSEAQEGFADWLASHDMNPCEYVDHEAKLATSRSWRHLWARRHGIVCTRCGLDTSMPPMALRTRWVRFWRWANEGQAVPR